MTGTEYIKTPSDDKGTSADTPITKKESSTVSERTILSMLAAKARGVHCGRPVAVVLSTKAKTTPGVKRSGKNKTKILTIEEIMNCADEGLSLNQAAKKFSLPQKTFYDFIVREGLKKSYFERMNAKRAEILESTPKKEGL